VTALERGLADLAQGRMVVVLDDEERENEGNLVLAAQLTTPEAINFMARQAGGWISLALSPEHCDRLGLETIAARPTAPNQAPFTQTVEARHGITTGISAADQTHSIQVAIDPRTEARDLVSPGHVQPLRARPGGVLERRGHTEAAVDLARLAGLEPAAVVCEIQNPDGSMARGEDLRRFCEEHDLLLLTVADVVAHRHLREPLVERAVDADLPTRFGPFTVVAYRSLLDHETHAALVKGDPASSSGPLVRIHPHCLTGDVFHASTCHCGRRLDQSLEAMEHAEAGVLVYLTPAARDLRLHGIDAPASDGLGVSAARVQGMAAQILKDLGVRSAQLLRAADDPVEELDGYGIETQFSDLLD
jgi:3,4-dihydroxy 2-butanone 4-phosphate synthase/GTP cyclohydrolase II